MITLKDWNDITPTYTTVFQVWIGRQYRDDNGSISVMINPIYQSWNYNTSYAIEFLKPAFGKEHELDDYNGWRVIKIIDDANRRVLYLKIEDFMVQNPSTGGTREVAYPEGPSAGTGGSYSKMLRL